MSHVEKYNNVGGKYYFRRTGVNSLILCRCVKEFKIKFYWICTVACIKDYSVNLDLSICIPSLGLFSFFSFLIFNKVRRIPWTGDQPVARPLPAHRTTQTQNKHTDIHASSGIRTHDPSFRASEAVHALDRAATVTGSHDFR
jgi:hypothetical protein